MNAWVGIYGTSALCFAGAFVASYLAERPVACFCFFVMTVLCGGMFGSSFDIYDDERDEEEV